MAPSAAGGTPVLLNARVRNRSPTATCSSVGGAGGARAPAPRRPDGGGGGRSTAIVDDAASTDCDDAVGPPGAWGPYTSDAVNRGLASACARSWGRYSAARRTSAWTKRQSVPAGQMGSFDSPPASFSCSCTAVSKAGHSVSEHGSHSCSDTFGSCDTWRIATTRTTPGRESSRRCSFGDRSHAGASGSSACTDGGAVWRC